MSLRRGLFHDPYLVGNGRWCSTCFPDGLPDTAGSFREATRWQDRIRRGCNECAGQGRTAFTAEELIAASIAVRTTGRAA